MRTYCHSDVERFVPHRWPPHVVWLHTVAFYPAGLVATSHLVTIDIIVVVFVVGVAVAVVGGGVGVGVLDACYCYDRSCN